MAKKVRLGDVLQILSSRGVSYAQVTHKHSDYGHLIRVFSEFYDSQDVNYSEVVAGEVQFSTFFAVQSAVNQGLLRVVANVSVHECLREFPVFRSRNGGSGGSIWLWNGSDSVRMSRPLLYEELLYPTEGIISAPLLVERIERGYRAEINEAW